MPEGENIGSLNVSIGADYSSLQSTLQQAESAAQAGGAAIGASFTSAAQSANVLQAAMEAMVSGAISFDEALQTVSADTGVVGSAAMAAAEQLDLFGNAVSGIPWADATGQLNLFTDELEPFDAALVTTAAVAETAASATTQLGTAAGTAAPEIDQADNSTKDLIQSLVGLGAAMVVVNQIEALGKAALDASDQIARAQISLTVLTGSASGASEEIAKLEVLGQQDGLSMPELLTAATRMQALLGAAAPVADLLAQLANSAAVSGQGIETAASAFDRMASSGTAAARSLLPLGINLQDLAGAFNQLSGTATATESNVASLFKQLSETERVEVLSAALNKLNGIADQVKNETFGGQWSALVAQWSQVLAEAGQALLPVIDDLIKITEVAIVPFLKGALDLFTAMPGPVKDVAVGLGLATTAAVATAAALGTLAIAINGVKGALANLGFSGALSGLGSVATETAEVGAAVATAGEAAEVAGPAFAILGASLSEFLIPIGAVVVALGGLAVWLGTAGDKSEEVASKISFAGNQIDLASDGIKKISDATQVSVTDLNTAIETYDRLNAAYGQHNASATEVAQALAAVNEAFAKLPGVAMPVGLALANNAQAAKDASNAYQTAKGVFDVLTAAYQAGLPVQAQWNAALAAMEAAEKKAADAGAPVAGSLGAIEVAVKNATDSMQALVTSQQLQTDKTVAQSDHITTLSADVIEASTRLDLLRQRQDSLSTAVTKGTALQSQLDDAMGLVSQAADALLTKTQALQIAQLAQGNSAADAAGKTGVLAQAVNESVLALQQAKEKFDAGKISATAYAGAQDAVVAAEIKLSDAQVDANANASRSTETWAAVSISLDQAKAKLAILTAAYQDHVGTLQAVQAAQKTALDAQIAVDQENAIAQTGLVGLTDKVSLYEQQLIAAKMKLDDVTEAYREQKATADQLLSAQQAVTTAQQNFNSAEAAAVSPIDAATSAMDRQISKMQALDAATQAASDKLDNFIELSDSLTGNTPGITISGGGKTVYAPGQAPHYQGAAGAYLNSQFLESGLVKPGTTITQDQLTQLTQQLDQVASSGGATGAALDKLEAAAVAFYEKSYSIPTLSDLTGTVAAAVTAATSSSSAPTPTGATSSTSAVAQSSSAAVDGGVYPDVTAHQASGEVWRMTLAGVSVGGGYSSTATDPNGTTALAASTTANAVAVASTTISSATDTFAYTVTQLASIASQVQQIAVTQSKNVTGTIQNLSAATSSTAKATGGGGSNVTGAITTSVNGSSETNYGLNPTAAQYALLASQAQAQATAAGFIWDGSVPWDGKGVPIYGANNPNAPAVSATNDANTAAQNIAKAQAAAAGYIWDGSVPWDGGGTPIHAVNVPNAFLPSVPSAQSGGGWGPAAGGITLDFRGANFSGANAADIQSMMVSTLPDILTRALRDNGGRM